VPREAMIGGDLLTIPEAAQHAGVSLWTVRSWIARATCPRCASTAGAASIRRIWRPPQRPPSCDGWRRPGDAIRNEPGSG